MKIIKTIGLLLFIAGFILFNASFFLSNHWLTHDILRQQVGDEKKASLFSEHGAEVLEKDFTSSIAFVSSIKDVFNKINESQLNQYKISDDDIDRLVNITASKFSISIADSVFSQQNEVSGFKARALHDYGAWLDGREFAGKEELRTQLKNVADNIAKYGIINQYGFDKYQVKNLTYSITKASTTGPLKNYPLFFLLLTIGLCVAGSLLYIFPKLESPPGIKNNGIFFNAMKNTGWLGIVTGSWLIGFYILLYFYPQYMTHWIIMVDPVSYFLKGSEAGQFFLYGFMYTLCILVMGLRMLIHYRHSRYQVIRTASVMFFQTAFAFLIPEILIRLNKPYFDFKNIWPLDYSFFFDSRIDQLVASGTLGIFMLGWGTMLVIIGVPVMVYFFGKRWYCSWVCGCGGLAETLGDPYRQLSNKKISAWRVERWMIHAVLVFAVVMTAGVLYTYWTGASYVLFFDSYKLRETYGALIGAGFAGVVGTGFYPFMGNRVWCRFGCPLAAYLGIIQRFKSRFRITTNGGQCISCGNCSTYCEMGIDVRWYAQRGQNIVRSSCVGCGICSSVCPRGVLNLEVKDEEGRFGTPILIGNNHITLNQ
jgi:Pyruvate/2-oxoacid:ferredoxin oxidoreductase delta subunit